MNTSLSKARAGVFLLLIAISLYSLFMISASNTSYAAGQSLFKFSSLIGLSPSANGYDRQSFRNSLADSLVSAADDIKVDVPSFKRRGAGINALDAGEVAEFLSSPRKSRFTRRIVAAASGLDVDKGNGIVNSNLLLAFSGATGGVRSGLVSECIQSLQPDLDTEELVVEEVIACILNGGEDNLLADNGNDPFGNGNGAGDPNANGGNGNGDPNDPNGTGTTAVVVAQVPEPSTYMLFGLGLIGLVGFSRKPVKARIT